MLWAVGHRLAVFAAKRDPDFAAVLAPPPPPEGLSRMLNLGEYRHSADRLADHLPWAALVAPGVVLNKDGSFQRTLPVSRAGSRKRDRGRTGLGLRAPQQCARALRLRLGAFFEAERSRALGYPESPISRCRLLAGRRGAPRAFREWRGCCRRRKRANRPHFESAYHLTLLYLPPADKWRSAERALLETPETRAGATGARRWRPSSPRPTACSTCSPASCPRSTALDEPRR